MVIWPTGTAVVTQLWDHYDVSPGAIFYSAHPKVVVLLKCESESRARTCVPRGNMWVLTWGRWPLRCPSKALPSLVLPVWICRVCVGMGLEQQRRVVFALLFPFAVKYTSHNECLFCLLCAALTYYQKLVGGWSWFLLQKQRGLDSIPKFFQLARALRFFGSARSSVCNK